MKSLMEQALGDEWKRLSPVLQAHYRYGTTTETGQMDIEYPRFMQPYLSVLRLFGALVDRGGRQIPTVVEKSIEGERQYWRRTIRYPNGKVVNFNSYWVSAGGNQVIEFVNPFLGLQMKAREKNGNIEYRGVRFVVKLGSWLLPIPESLVLGRTTIVEVPVDNNRFSMDFRITHPLFGQIFRYSGEFQTTLTDS
ncbi:hypothetical protein BOW53_13675 [Solemya pervernicosa gill symbiont]|uniref:DUF4166 domain-containing protein n=1 Tax=Solemya pervernicosa gill symbiont TaxID=642797 RepID=A0A1T2L1I5_9GAMM|nr:DUF4166 domain-containing protein [Solemya pervernicosa gill symbiont]OOZ38949.1 hypothetical protein BOW53_13675 [Solemya pervernicosa gill symbiont]